jgi:HAD superfamily hydrolase (TIGR01509 family)
MIKGVLFDIDGTLMDTNNLHVTAWVRAFRQGGYSIPPERITVEIGKGGDNLIPSILGEPQSKADEEEQQRISDGHGDEYMKLIDQARPFPAAANILALLHQRGIKIALATSAGDDEVKHYLGYLNADQNVDEITTIADVKDSKPAPDVFAVALKKLGLEPSEAVAVGDTPYDISAARKIDLPCVAVVSGGFSRAQLEAAQPVAIFQNVSELQNHLDELIQLDFNEEQPQ